MDEKIATLKSVKILLKDVVTQKIQATCVFQAIKTLDFFISYKSDNHKIKPLHIILPKASSYVKNYDGKIKWMYFLLKMISY